MGQIGWNNGTMEYWNDGTMGEEGTATRKSAFQSASRHQ
jgi:hypothetical protein